jgi:hypothetical protein
MNQKLVESLAQIILSLSDEEQQWLERELQKASVSGQVQDLKLRLKQLEDHYQMSSEDFYQRFQTGELEDTIDFFEWNTYCEIVTTAESKYLNQIHLGQYSPNVQQTQSETVSILQSWIDDEDEAEQQETGRYLVQVLDEDRLSDRKLFSDE